MAGPAAAALPAGAAVDGDAEAAADALALGELAVLVFVSNVMAWRSAPCTALPWKLTLARLPAFNWSRNTLYGMAMTGLGLGRALTRLTTFQIRITRAISHHAFIHHAR